MSLQGVWLYCELDSIPQAADGFLTLVETSIMSLSNLRANPKPAASAMFTVPAPCRAPSKMQAILWKG